MNKEWWWCADCEDVRDLDRHGRCATCGSDSVCVASRLHNPKKLVLPTDAEVWEMLEAERKRVVS